MPRRKNAIPSRLDGRASVASVIEQLSQDTAELAMRLRKPASMIESEDADANLAQMAGSLIDMAQRMSNLSVGITLGRIQIHQAPAREHQPTLFDSLSDAPEN